MQLCISKTDTLKSICMKEFSGVIHLTAKKYLLYKRKLLESWWVSILEIHTEVSLRN
jgi:hypothetical protein